jgi:AcrR family transcriptional regulator
MPLGDRVDTKELLCQEAIWVIAERGVQGTTIKEIARRANLTPAMVHYHFKDKANLIQHTLRHHLKPISDSVWEAADLDIGPLEMLREFHGRLTKVFTTIPWYRSFWSRELAGIFGNMRTFMASFIGKRRLTAFREKIELGQRQGLINPFISPELVFPTLLAVIYLPRLGHDTYTGVWGTRLDEETINRHVWATIVDGFSAKDAGRLK